MILDFNRRGGTDNWVGYFGETCGFWGVLLSSPLLPPSYVAEQNMCGLWSENRSYRRRNLHFFHFPIYRNLDYYLCWLPLLTCLRLRLHAGRRRTGGRGRPASTSQWRPRSASASVVTIPSEHRTHCVLCIGTTWLFFGICWGDKTWLLFCSLHTGRVAGVTTNKAF